MGIGAPGSVDPENGKVMFAGNLGWKDVALKKELEKQLRVAGFSAKRLQRLHARRP